METIPLRPLFENEQFKTLNPDLKFFVLNALYKLCISREYRDPLPKHLMYLLQCSQTCYLKNKTVFRDILESVLPEISKIKNDKNYQILKASRANSDNALKRKKKLNSGTIVEEFLDNPAPLLPQHSAFAAQLRKERIPNEHVFKNPIKPVTNSKPMLTEKPR